MAGEESLLFWIGTAGFGLAALLFTGITIRRKAQTGLNTEVFVSFITAVSYAVMALGIATITSPLGEPIYWSRWLFYIGSCSLLTTDIAHLNKKSNSILLQVALLTGLTMFNGYLASVILTVDRWWFFGFSTAAFLGVLWVLFQSPTPEIPSMPKLLAFVAVTWTLFPVVWIFAPTGFGLISTYIEVVLYGILDLVTKIVFGLYLTLKVKTQ